MALVGSSRMWAALTFARIVYQRHANPQHAGQSPQPIIAAPLRLLFAPKLKNEFSRSSLIEDKSNGYNATILRTVSETNRKNKTSCNGLRDATSNCVTSWEDLTPELRIPPACDVF